MADTRGAELLEDGNASEIPLESSTLLAEGNVPQKTTHTFTDSEEPDDSGHQNKKRRTDSEPEGFTGALHSAPGIGDSSVDQIEGNLVSALSPNVTGPQHLNGSHSNPDARDDDSTKNGAASELTPDSLTSDVATAISNIVEHTERVEEQCAAGQQQSETTPASGSKGLVFLKANSHLKAQSLPILDNLSTQILGLLAKSTYQEIISLVSEPESENGQAYATMRSLFEHTKRVYSTKAPFLSPTELDLTEPHQVDIIRKANLASFVSSIFGTQEIGFSEMNDHFLDVFVPEGSRLLKVQGALFLELKTQAFIASLNNSERPRTEVLFDLFPDDLEQRLLARRPGNRQPAPSEIDFVKRARSRRDILLGEINNQDSVDTLPNKYHWEDFLRDLSSYISKNFDVISNQQTKKAPKGRPSILGNGEAQERPSAPIETHFTVAPQPPVAHVDRNVHGDLVARAARAAQIALQGQGVRMAQQREQQTQPPQHSQHTQHTPAPQQHLQHSQPQHTQAAGQAPHPVQALQQAVQSPQPDVSQHQHQFHNSPTPPAHHQSQQPSQPQPQQAGQFTFQQSPIQPNFQQYNPASPASITARANAAAVNYGYMPGVPHYSQSQPTQILYERARLAATAKSSPTSRRPGLPSQRRPWTTEEENALMAGLDRVKGPHWSQILAMFGPGGTINESLKDRNQVQLKDKARNLKLFFLKSGIEVPYYLKFVTGELKTRAPAQAAKNEARERERKQGEEDKAHVEGIEGMMALAGAHSPHIAPGPAPDRLSGSPLVPAESETQSIVEQTPEQHLMQSLGQEIKSEPLAAVAQSNAVDPNLPTV